MNSGTYTFEKPTEPEPHTFIVSDYRRKTEAEIRKEIEEEYATVSLYNLLDYSAQDLRTLSVAVRDQIRSIENIKLKLTDTYTSLCAWKTLIDSAIIEKQQCDSEAWAEKTAKEINETL